jgi:hypothetical protein
MIIKYNIKSKSKEKICTKILKKKIVIEGWTDHRIDKNKGIDYCCEVLYINICEVRYS